MLLPSLTLAPPFPWRLADQSTVSLVASGLGHAYMVEGGERVGGGFHHVPVLFHESLHYMGVRSGGVYVDATLGGAGHAEAVLKAGGRLIGIDRDPDALAHAAEVLAGYGDAVVLRRSNFSQMAAVVDELAAGGVDGVLMDLGVSSHQLDCAERGFSLRADGPLDMRMDPGESLTAAEIVNTWGEDELLGLFRELGEEKRARAVAREIVRRRGERSFSRTMELADCVASVVRKTGRTHPATRVFQALRMKVNRELESLEEALEAIPSLLRPGGRLVVISFHSLEDRIVKRFMQRLSAREIDRPEWPEARPNPELALRVLTKRPVTAKEGELGGNPRARSAKLRAAERLNTNEQ